VSDIQDYPLISKELNAPEDTPWNKRVGSGSGFTIGHGYRQRRPWW